tara:strand:+ start:89 stop:490 length:402 start_codon:yes stop_codon:yes gene_type:complete
MPRKSSASKSTATAPKAPRKTRTRKTSTALPTVKSKAVNKEAIEQCLKAPIRTLKPVKKVTVTTFKGGKVVAKKTTLKRPSSARLITPQRYWQDIQTRWAIHNYEIQELLKDFTKGLEAVKPYHAQLVKSLNK